MPGGARCLKMLGTCPQAQGAPYLAGKKITFREFFAPGSP